VSNTIHENKINLTIQWGKLLAAIMIVFIHAPFPTPLGGVVEAAARFAVPFFFAVSGYFSYEISLEKIRRRCLSMLQITLIATVLCLFLRVTVLSATVQGHAWAFIKACFDLPSLSTWIFLSENPVEFHLWYLSVICGCYLALWLYVRFVYDKIGYRLLYQCSAVFLLAHLFLGSLLPTLGIRISILWYRNIPLFGLPMFALGLFLREKQTQNHRMFACKPARLFLLFCVGTILSVVQRILVCEIELPIGSLMAVVALLLFCIQNPDLIKVKKKAQWNAALGTICLISYIIHPLLQEVLVLYCPALHGSVNPYLWPFVIAACSLSIGYLYHLVSVSISGRK